MRRMGNPRACLGRNPPPHCQTLFIQTQGQAGSEQEALILCAGVSTLGPLFLQHMLAEHSLCARHPARHQGHRNNRHGAGPRELITDGADGSSRISLTLCRGSPEERHNPVLGAAFCHILLGSIPGLVSFPVPWLL